MTDPENWMEREGTSFEEHPKRFFAKWTAIVLAIIIFFSVIGNAFGLVSIYWSAAKAKITAQPRVTSKIYETENIIAKVTFFHTKCANFDRDLLVFQNNYQRYVADKEALKDSTLTALEKNAAQSQLPNDISDYTAALNVAQEDAANYNAEAANPTSAPFRTIFHQHGLPERINLPAGTQAAYTYSVSCG